MGIFLFELFVFNWNAGFGRTNLGAITAVVAFIGIDYIFGITGGDGVLGAFRQAGIAQDAIIGNLVRQIFPPFTTDWRPGGIAFFRKISTETAFGLVVIMVGTRFHARIAAHISALPYCI